MHSEENLKLIILSISLSLVLNLPRVLSTSLLSISLANKPSLTAAQTHLSFALNPASLSQSLTSTQEIHESMASKESRVKISPSAVTTAPMMLKSSSFLFKSRFVFDFGIRVFVVFCPPPNFVSVRVFSFPFC